ncbi:hypothetical protein DBR43_28255 [Pedobacter sp. KBW06]|uniref:AraC family transcriptional regulator n=1 Tax=Pedobacter sp. KBW06 TaxID=2153359 RepID=UPI000F5A8505|nr:AraC family transcriptional regulator [Pedobacter sp. KBW06]RQO66128.1 hypothetical protein DBR43_28255 [Pedobacter sp. KBW06]
MIISYHLEDFSAPFSIPGQFMMDRFEDVGKPADMVWPHKHSFYEVLWIEKGNAQHLIDQHTIDLHSDTLFFIAPGQIHELGHSENVKGYSIMFSEEFLSLSHANPEMLAGLSFLENSYSRPSLSLAPQQSEELGDIIGMLLKESGRKDRSASIIRHLLLALLFQIQRMMAGEASSEADNIQVLNLKKFKKLIEEYYKKETKLSFFSAQLFMTNAHLNEIAKKITGKTAGELIRERVLLEAKRMLIHGHWTVGQIASELGFKDFSYFSRHFKKQEGLTPAEFRKSSSPSG